MMNIAKNRQLTFSLKINLFPNLRVKIKANKFFFCNLEKTTLLQVKDGFFNEPGGD